MLKSVVLALGAMFCFAAPAAADAFKSIDDCKVGKRVADSSNKIGVITHVDHSESGCQVRLNDGRSSYYLFWMLHPAGGSKETSDRLVPGKYECFADGHYADMDVTITGANSYSAAGSRGTFSVRANNDIVFNSGSLAHYHGHLKPGPSIGLNSNGDSFYGTTCDRAH